MHSAPITEIEIPERVIEAAAKALHDEFWPSVHTHPCPLCPQYAHTALQAALKEWGAKAWWAIEDRDDPDDMCRWGSYWPDLVDVRERVGTDLSTFKQLRTRWELIP